MTKCPFHRSFNSFAAFLLAWVISSVPNDLRAVDDGVMAPADAYDPYTEATLTTAGVGSVGNDANNGSPLRYWMDPYLRTWAYADNGADGWVRQYQSQYFTTLRINGQSGPQVCGVHQSDSSPYGFEVVSGPTSSTSNGKQLITSVVTTDNGGIRITHTITYQPGEYRIRHDWKVENISSAPAVTYSGLALRFGGACNLGGVDASAGGWDEAARFLYCVRNDNGDSGRMGFQEVSGAEFNGVVEGYSYDITDGLMVGSANFPVPDLEAIGYASPNSYFTPFNAPNAMAVEWQRSPLVSGSSFQVYAYERWIPAGSIQVVAPSELANTAYPGEQVTVDFRVSNLLNTYQQSVTLAAVPPSGWSTNTLESPQWVSNSDYFIVPVSLQTITVPVTVTVPSNAPAGTYYLSLEALGEIDTSQVSRSRAVVLDGASSDRIAITIVGNPTATVTAPAIPLSTGGRVIYTAISPSTSEGIDSVIAALSGRSTSVTRAFAWDNSTQTYVEVPRSRPTGGIQTYTGIFIATREPLRYSLSGTSTSAPFTLTLRHRGWTFAGIPPVTENQGTPITTFAWQVTEAGSEAPPVNVDTYPYSLADAMGTTGSGNDTTSRPWFWNGSAYVQVDELVAGRGYWFKNNLDQDLTLTTENVARARLAKPSPEVVTTASATTVPRDIGSPPAMPADSVNEAGSANGSKCGTGSGVAGFVLLAITALFGLRLRRVERP